jgi:hypothetical protein
MRDVFSTSKIIFKAQEDEVDVGFVASHRKHTVEELLDKMESVIRVT